MTRRGGAVRWWGLPHCPAMAGIVDRIKSWFNKQEQSSLEYDQSHADFVDHQHMTDHAKPHIEDRIADPDD